MTTFTLNQRMHVHSVTSMATGETVPAFDGRVVQLPVFGWIRVVDDRGRVWLRRVGECEPINIGRQLCLSLARDDIRRARMYFNQVTFSGFLYNQDVIDQIIEYAHDAQRDARQHLEAAVRS